MNSKITINQLIIKIDLKEIIIFDREIVFVIIITKGYIIIFQNFLCNIYFNLIVNKKTIFFLIFHIKCDL